MTTLILNDQGLTLSCKYDAGLVAELKARVPATERRFDPASKCWVVAPGHQALMVHLVGRYLGEQVTVLGQVKALVVTETRLLDVRYVGQCKERGGGQRSAFGYCEGEWSVIFPEDVLEMWFLGMVQPTTNGAPAPAGTLYQVLGVTQTASVDEIKAGFRRMARQWHPDVCKEPNANEMFLKIKEAYDLLSSGRRAMYDAGLVMEQLSATTSQQSFQPAGMMWQGYRSPLRCGYILAEGQMSLGRFVVSKILAWKDIVDEQGRTLVTSWVMGAKTFMEAWV